MNANYKYYSNINCEYFPCHADADNECFNCLFCYCPLYALGPNCGGNFSYINGKTKDCSACLIPHSKDGYEFVIKKFGDIQALASMSE